MTALTPAIRAFLDEPRFAVLATVNADGILQQTVMWY
ncbi:MAG: pyridoxamine 5'-phosphate oxidase family protein, partial [Thermomicrobiales bacterium]